jgi:hypothetical protein
VIRFAMPTTQMQDDRKRPTNTPVREDPSVLR